MRRPPASGSADHRFIHAALGEVALWGGAAIAMCGLYLGAAAYILRDPPVDMAADGPPPAIMVELAPLPEAAVPDEVEIGKQEQNVEPEEAGIAPPPDEPESEPDESPEPDDATPPEDAEVALPEPARPEDRPVRKEPRKKPTPETPQRERPKKEAQAPQKVQTRAATQAPKAAQNAAAQPQTGRRGATVSPARWQSRLMAHLERRKRYPTGARARREQGTVQVRFSIDAQGNVTSVALANSSGYSELDQAVMDLVRRASPVPAPPPGVNRSIVAPIHFSIR